VEEQRSQRALVALLLVALDHQVTPLLPGRPGVKAPKIGLLIRQYLSASSCATASSNWSLPAGK
jgi:hypothetical protein